MVPVELTDEEREQLEAWVRRRSTPQAIALRARFVLQCERGLAHGEVARRCERSPQTVGKRRRRFAAGRLQGLDDAYCIGTPRTVGDERVAEVVRATLEPKPADATHWSTRSLAKQLGLSQSTVGRIWRAFGLQPHRQAKA